MTEVQRKEAVDRTYAIQKQLGDLIDGDYNWSSIRIALADISNEVMRIRHDLESPIEVSTWNARDASVMREAIAKGEPQ